MSKFTYNKQKPRDKISHMNNEPKIPSIPVPSAVRHILFRRLPRHPLSLLARLASIAGLAILSHPMSAQRVFKYSVTAGAIEGRRDSCVPVITLARR